VNVFVDTSALYAVLVRGQAQHVEASTRWQQLLTDRAVRLFTSNYVVLESCALVNRRLGKQAVVDLCRALVPATTVLWVDQAAHHAATEAMLVTGRDGPSLVDCTSFALMDAHGINQAFAYDKHFDDFAARTT
jgi:uncharacterized protein